MTTSHPETGYTLIEMLVVLVLVSILVSSGAPSLQGYMNRHRTERALDQVASDVALARLVAVREGRPAVISFDAGGYVIEVTRAGGTVTTVKTVNLSQEYAGVTLFTEADIGFSSRGLLLSGGEEAVVWVQNSYNRDSLFVSPAGRIYRDY